MKKIILTFLGILFISTCFSQVFMGGGFGRNGISAFLGADVENINIKYQGILPFSSNEKPVVHSINLGYSINIKDIITITPHGGLSVSTTKDFSVYNNGGRQVIENGITYYYDDIIITRKTKAIYGAEISKTWNMGRLFIYGNNYGAGLGMSVVFVDED